MSSSVGTGTERRISRRISSASRSRIRASVVGTSRWPKTGSASASRRRAGRSRGRRASRTRARRRPSARPRAGSRPPRAPGGRASRARARRRRRAPAARARSPRSRRAARGSGGTVGERLLRQRCVRTAGSAGSGAPRVRPGSRACTREQEAVELRLGQRERALELDRVLRREHEERLGQRVRLAVDGDLPLLHRLEQRRLRLRRRAVDLVGEERSA